MERIHKISTVLAADDSPVALAGDSPTHSGSPVLTSFIYSGAPFSDSGFEFGVLPAATQAASTTTVSSSAPTTLSGDTVTLTATVTPSSGSGATPTGAVTFLEDGNSLGTSSLASSGTATFETSTLQT